MAKNTGDRRRTRRLAAVRQILRELRAGSLEASALRWLMSVERKTRGIRKERDRLIRLLPEDFGASFASEKARADRAEAERVEYRDHADEAEARANMAEAEVERLRAEVEHERSMACIEPPDDCSCPGCVYADDFHGLPDA